MFILNASSNNKENINNLSKLLTEYGYTVFSVGYQNENIKKSKIYAQNANYDLAKQISQDINNVCEIVVGNLGPPESDVTILVGDDFPNVIR